MSILLLSLYLFSYITPKIGANPKIIHVPQDYPEINEAVEAANEGDTILVAQGIYHESEIISIYKNDISIIGENPDNTIIELPSELPGYPDVFYISGSGITISGFTIQRKTSTLDRMICGIHLWYAKNCVIKGNKIRGNGIGITLYCTQNILVEGNYIENNDVAFLLEFDPDSSGNIIRNNTVQSNNYVVTFVTNPQGGSSENFIYHNNFKKYTSVVWWNFGPELTIYWDNGYPSGGNYWDDYVGVDEKSGPSQDQPGSDGIGDTPYIIDENNKDRYPLMGSYNPTYGPVEIETVYPNATTIYVGDKFQMVVRVKNKGNTPVYVSPVVISSFFPSDAVKFLPTGFVDFVSSVIIEPNSAIDLIDPFPIHGKGYEAEKPASVIYNVSVIWSYTEDITEWDYTGYYNAVGICSFSILDKYEVRFSGIVQMVDANPTEPSKYHGDWGIEVLKVFEGEGFIKSGDEAYVTYTPSGEEIRIDAVNVGDVVEVCGAYNTKYNKVELKYKSHYLKKSETGYQVNLLFSQQSVEKGGILNAYFQVLKYDEGGEVYPVNGVPVELETPFGSQVLESINHLGLDGIIVASYDLSNYQEDSFSIYIRESSYNGLPITPPSVNPVIFDISERMSKIEFGTAQPGSVTLGLHVEGVCGQTFVIETDGESVNDISYSELWKGGIGVEYNLFKAKLGVIHLDAGVKLSGGLLTSIEYYLSGSSETEKQQILKHLITKWILTNIISYAELSPSSPVSASLLKAARALIDAELDRLGFYENSEKTLTPGGYIRVSSGAEAWIGLSSKYGTLDVGKIAYAGASGEAELEGLINVYSPSKFGFVGKFDFEAGIGAGLNLDLGFLKIGSEVSAFRSEVELMSELIYEDGQFTSLELEFAFELPTYVYDFLDFYGLAKPFQQLMKLYWPSGPVALVVHYSIPVGKLTEDILLYLSSLDIGTVELETIFNHVLNLVATTPIEYSVSLKQKANVNVGIGLGIDGFSFDVGWEYEQTTEYIVEQGVLYNFQKWPIISYTQKPKEIDVIDFIKDYWTYDGQHPQPSGTIIQLNENQQHLYLHVYDVEGKHVGLEYETNITENEIPDSYYFDNENGTITVVLPSTTTNFSIIIDGAYSREDRESYNLTVVALSSERADYKVVSGEIQKGTVKGYKINIPETGSPIATENRAPIAQFTYSPSNPKAKQEIQFTDQSSDIDGKIISWFWDFGDGTNSTRPNPKHIYQKPGTYQVTLRIIDDGFISQTITKTVTIQPETTILQDPKMLSIIIISIIVIFLISIFALRRRKPNRKRSNSLATK